MRPARARLGALAARRAGRRCWAGGWRGRLHVAGCGRRDDPHGPLDFWAMGREAEVVAELLPAFQARHPGIEVRVQQLPWTAAHEKLLTAYAGDAMPDLCQLGNTWLPEFGALDALEPLDARVAAPASPRDDYFAGILDTNVMPTRERLSASSACRGTSTRACSSIAPTCCARPATPQPPQTGTSGATRCGDVRRAGGGRSYGALLPLNEPTRCSRWPAARRAARRRRHARRVLAARRSGARWLLRRLFHEWSRAGDGAAQIANV